MSKLEYENTLVCIINKTTKALLQLLDQELRKNAGITCSQWKIIFVLTNNKHGLTQKEIADRLGLEGPSLIPIIDKSEKDGFLIRKVDTEDRRNNRIFLTDKSYSILDSMINCGLNVGKRSIKDIPEENINITKQTLEKMWQNIHNEFGLNPSSPENNQKIKNMQEIEVGPSACDIHSTALENR